MTHVTIGRWGRNLALRVPNDIATEIGLHEGDRVEIETEDGIRLTTSDPEFEAQMEVARGLMKKWHNVLRELAK